jgi:hypothetical protein
MLARSAGSEPAERPFPAASMVKLFLVDDVLHRARTGAISLTPGDRARLEAMIRSSDDPAASDCGCASTEPRRSATSPRATA